MGNIRCSNIHYNYDIEMCNWLLKHGAKAIGCGTHNKTGNTFILTWVSMLITKYLKIAYPTTL